MRQRTIKKREKVSRRTKKGGRAVAFGSYGCVFKPALRCKDQTERPDKPDTKYISKLMKNYTADDEYEIIKRTSKLIKKIPNYRNYFVIDDITMCKPAPLDSEDNIDLKMCKSTLGMRGNTISKTLLNQLKVITAPDMGVDIAKAIKNMNNELDSVSDADKEMLVKENLIKLNNQLILLLKNAVEPMNAEYIVHNDLKGHNIMTSYVSLRDVDKNFNYAKMIDFGLMEQVDIRDSGQGIIDAVMSVVMFNGPMYSVIMSTSFLEMMRDEIEQLYPDDETRYSKVMMDMHSEENTFAKQLLTPIKSYVMRTLKGTDHWSHVKYEFEWCKENMTSNMNHQFEFVYAMNILIGFLRILSINSNTGEVLMAVPAYYRDVLRYNIDIVGTISSFNTLTTRLFNNDYLKKSMNDVIARYATFIYKYKYNYNYAGRRIDMKELVRDIELLNWVLKPSDDAVCPVPRMRQIEPVEQSVDQENQIDDVGQVANQMEDVVLTNTTLYSMKGKKRCPNGYVRHKRIKNKCVKKRAPGRAVPAQ